MLSPVFIGWTNKFCSSVGFRSVMSFTGKNKASSQGEYFEQDDRIRMSVLFYFSMPAQGQGIWVKVTKGMHYPRGSTVLKL